MYTLAKQSLIYAYKAIIEQAEKKGLVDSKKGNSWAKMLLYVLGP